MGRTSIHDVARAANVSISTVSRVLNGRDRVKASTRKRVQDAIINLNFQPDNVARAMVTKKTNAIGLIVPQLMNEHWAALSEVIQSVLWDAGYHLMIYTTGFDRTKELALLDMMFDRNLDGIIYACRPLNQDTVKRLTETGVPMVGLEPSLDGFPCVLGDHLQGAKLAVNHLIEMGHREIAHIGGRRLSSAREVGYRDSLCDHGLPVHEHLIVRDPELSESFTSVGFEATKFLLSNGRRFTAIFCANDLVAIGAITALREDGIAVPNDIAIVGFDDISIASLFTPSLTTIRQPIERIGETAANLVIELVRAGHCKHMQSKILYGMELVVRESSQSFAVFS